MLNNPQNGNSQNKRKFKKGIVGKSKIEFLGSCKVMIVSTSTCDIKGITCAIIIWLSKFRELIIKFSNPFFLKKWII